MSNRLFRPVPSRTAAGLLSRGSKQSCSAQTAVTKRSAQSRPAQMHRFLQVVPRARRERSAAWRFSTLQAIPGRFSLIHYILKCTTAHNENTCTHEASNIRAQQNFIFVLEVFFLSSRNMHIFFYYKCLY